MDLESPLNSVGVGHSAYTPVESLLAQLEALSGTLPLYAHQLKDVYRCMSLSLPATAHVLLV